MASSSEIRFAWQSTGKEKKKAYNCIDYRITNWNIFPTFVKPSLLISGNIFFKNKIFKDMDIDIHK